MKIIPSCPECGSDYTYKDGTLFICPECAYEWDQKFNNENDKFEEEIIFKDVNGNILANGDSVTIVKDLKIGGGSGVIKRGTKVKNIRLVEGDHDIDCKIPGFGPMQLKTSVVKKS